MEGLLFNIDMVRNIAKKNGIKRCGDDTCVQLARTLEDFASELCRRCVMKLESEGRVELKVKDVRRVIG